MQIARQIAFTLSIDRVTYLYGNKDNPGLRTILSLTLEESKSALLKRHRFRRTIDNR
jgi:hypothetical protein